MTFNLYGFEIGPFSYLYNAFSTSIIIELTQIFIVADLASPAANFSIFFCCHVSRLTLEVFHFYQRPC
jgi:hypothetical protein